MKRVYIVISLLAALQVAVAQEPEYRSKNYPDGGLMYDGHFIRENPVDVTRYYQNGKIQSVQQFDEAGNSTVKMYNSDATLFAEGAYSGRQRDGEWKFYNAKGGVSMVVTYKDGLKDGKMVIYTTSGSVHDSLNYASDKLDGERIQYFTNGQVMRTMHYKGGVLDGRYVSYFDNGDLDAEGGFSEGLRDGVWKFYREDGTVESFKFKKGYSKKYEEKKKREEQEIETLPPIEEPSVGNIF